MNIQVYVTNQKLKIVTNLKTLVSGSQEFIKFEFILDEDWDGLTVFAQFRQGDVAYNKYLDEDNCVYLPPDTQPGDCLLMLYGTKDLVIATTNYVHMVIDENMILKDASSVEITEPLYNQLVEMVHKASLPHIGENGNWYYDDEDTGVSALGEIIAAKDDAVDEINSIADGHADAIAEAVNNAEIKTEELNEAVATQVDKVNTAGTTQVSAVNAAGAARVTEVTSEIEAASDAALTDIDNKKTAALAEIPEDYTALSALANQLSESKAPAIEVEASGSIVTIDDAAALPVVSLISTIEPVQAAGTPTPEAPLAISGWDAVTVQRTGKNLIPPNFKANTALGANGNTIVEYPSTGTYCMEKSIMLYPGKYTISGVEKAYPYVYDANGVIDWDVSRPSGVVTPYTFTLTKPMKFRAAGGANAANSYQLESGSAATSYEPYQGQTLTAPLPDTVYGGTLDWKTGVLTVTHERNTMDTLTAKTYGVTNTGLPYVDLHLPSYPYTRQDSKTVSNAYVWSSVATAGQHGYIRTYENALTLYDDRFTDLSEAVRILEEMEFEAIVNLRTTYTIQLTPQQIETLKGTNNVWSDCGDTSLVYVADTKMYIDKQINAALALMTN